MKAHSTEAALFDKRCLLVIGERPGGARMVSLPYPPVGRSRDKRTFH
ncbi:hypothetical protein X946_3949 [Burkholderia sp. ABCPW 111]|nr:hypothetical protein X946_3949 [Burkholderia sp. ABCPW 111]